VNTDITVFLEVVPCSLGYLYLYIYIYIYIYEVQRSCLGEREREKRENGEVVGDT
jgi:hypothetical protein